MCLAPDAVQRLADLRARYDASVVTAFPAQQMQTLAEAHVLPLLALTYTSWLPLPLVWASRDPRFLAANGQVLWVDREAYLALGGFEAVADAIVDDMAFCRRAKEHGRRVVFADGQQIARCRMYGSGAALWVGSTENLYEGLGEHPGRLALALALYGWAFVAPYLALLIGAFTGGALLIAGAVGVAANLALRAGLAGSRGHRPSSVISHPIAVCGLLVLAVDSARRTTSGRLRWAGRTYARRADRGVA